MEEVGRNKKPVEGWGLGILRLLTKLCSLNKYGEIVDANLFSAIELIREGCYIRVGNGKKSEFEWTNGFLPLLCI